MRDLITLALTSHAMGENVLRKAVWRDIRGQVATGDPEAVLQWGQKSLSPEDFQTVSDRIALINQAREAVEEWSRHGILVVTEFDERYPGRYLDRLKGAHPPLLFVAGEPRLLSEPLIGIVGSRDVDDVGAAFAAGVAEEAGRLGFGVVSGGARGVDKIAMKAAYDAGAPSVGVLADSLQRSAGASDTRQALEDGRVCLVSPFLPTAGFSVGNAMGRNKLVYALSKATVVVASSEGSGGTWAGAVEALEKGYCPVLVRPESEGAGTLVARGAAKLSAPPGLGAAVESSAPSQGSLL